ncbi:MAG: adenine deaminase [Eubacteriales bacterium]|nr:adenine deaminase [Eubacteriales bacterium]
MNNHVIDVALGNAAADMVIKNGKLLNVHTGEIYETEIAIADKVIAAVGHLGENTIGENTKVIDAQGKIMVPGFIDAHIHFESSMLTYTEFSRMLVKHGTTAVATDLMEIAIVAGEEGINNVLKESEGLPVKLLQPIPAFMSEEGELQTIGAALYPEMIEKLIKGPHAVGLAEVLYPPILNKSPLSAWMLELAEKYGKTAEGHAPELYGSQLNAYASAGIRSDHESTNKEEALGKLRAGLRVLIREGSAAQDLDAVVKMITENNVDTRHCALVSDDIDMLHIHEKGHLDYKVRRAIKAGVDPVKAIQMVTLNPAESLKVDNKYGSIAPGKCADIVFLSDLENCTVDSVISNGEYVVENGETIYEYKKPEYSSVMLNTVKLSKEITGDDLVIKTDANAKKAKVRVIGAKPTSLLTDALEAELDVVDGVIMPNAAEDVLRIACVERYGKGGSIGKSFIKGFGISKGAIATSVGHDHHNITVVGSDADDMAAAVNRIKELNGGLVIAEDGKVKYELPLPICGLLTDLSGEESALILKKMQEDLQAKGCEMGSPYMTLAFITLIFIPFYGITDKGLVDVINGKVIDPVISAE